MKLVSFATGSGVHHGAVEEEWVVDLGTDLASLLPTGQRWPIAGLELLAPVPRPGKIICVGFNYLDHVTEVLGPARRDSTPKSPTLFAKFANTVVGHQAPVILPSCASQIDYEAELGVVIGRTARRVHRDESLDYVLGYTCVNDVSARDIQTAERQWFRAKSLDTFLPMGPWIVTADELPDPQTLKIECSVNGDLRQSASTADMVFDVATVISHISEGITLEPGDVICTGTPAGIGMKLEPPTWLQDGDVVSVSIEGIGTLTNPITSLTA